MAVTSLHNEKALFLAGTLRVSAKGVSQQVTLHLKNATLKQTFREIQRQTGYTPFMVRAAPMG